jgi:hypothetical protein
MRGWVSMRVETAGRPVESARFLDELLSVDFVIVYPTRLKPKDVGCSPVCPDEADSLFINIGRGRTPNSLI